MNVMFEICTSSIKWFLAFYLGRVINLVRYQLVRLLTRLLLTTDSIINKHEFLFIEICNSRSSEDANNC